MQVFEASLEQPRIKQVVGYYADAFLIGDVLAPKFVNCHLVNAFAELADSVGDYGDAFKHLACNCVYDVKQLDEHFFIKCLLSFCFQAAAGTYHAFPTCRIGRFDFFVLCIPSNSRMNIFVLLVGFLQVFDCEKACIDPLTLYAE